MPITSNITKFIPSIILFDAVYLIFVIVYESKINQNVALGILKFLYQQVYI
jgi:hypothetical protein